MDREVKETGQQIMLPTPTLVELMLSEFDELIELDYIHGHARSLKHTEGKLFAPLGGGVSLADARRHTAENMIHPDDVERYLRESDPEAARQHMSAEGASSLHRSRFRFKQLGGGWRWMEQVAISGSENGVPPGLCYIFMFDVQSQVEEGMNLPVFSSAGMRSELTGLLAEEPFYQAARSRLSVCSEGWCVLVIDLEHFKLFNEWYGRKNGDMLLAQIGAHLSQVEESSGGLACYFGQDDFGLLMPYDKEQIETLYAAVHTLIKEYGTSVGFMPAFGVAMVSSEYTVEELCDHAAVAARYAKENYHTRIRTFELSMYRQTERDYQILSDFQKALRDHELIVVFQPQCRISTHRVVGAESLVRWRRENGELMQPALFVPVLERYGFVTDLDEYVWDAVCAWQRKWIDGGHTPLPVSVNVSQIDIFTIDVAEHFEALVKKYDLPAEVIKIEITESAYVDNDAVSDTVRRLRKKGFLVLMDDFGSGYSSLNMLRSLNVDIIKLDAHFLRMNGDDRAKGMQIMESIVNLSKTMSVPIIVEGVETKEETDFLIGLGCRYVQGFHFYRPLFVEDYEKLIADPQNIDTRGFFFKVREQFHTREFLDENVFSDTMLNNILGPVAFFLRHGSEIDILRYNQQFYNEIHSPLLISHLRSSQRVVVPEDQPILQNLFDQAEKNPLSGSNGVVHFHRSNGTTTALQIQLFFLEENDAGKRFYGSVHDITQARQISSQMQLLSRVSPDIIVFLRLEGKKWVAQVVIDGLESVLGFDRNELERELNEGSFFQRIAEKDRNELVRLVQDSNMQLEAFSPPFSVTCANGNQIMMRVGVGGVQDRSCGVDRLLILRRSADGA